MSNYKLPDFIYPTYSVNFDPVSQSLYSQHNTLDLNYLEKTLNSNEYVILDFNRDHSNFLYGPTTVLDAYQYFSGRGYKNIIYLTCEKVDQDLIYFFPSWLYCKSLQYKNIHLDLQFNRHQKLSCLNRFPSPHRIYFYYKLIHLPYFEECLTSFLGLLNPYNNLIEIGEYNPIYNEVPDYVKQFYEKTKFQRKLCEDMISIEKLHDPNHPAYTDCYMNIITESTYYHSFYTEKTAKSLVTEQLFMILGGSNSISNLKTLGIECFDLINIDYDTVHKFVDRADIIIDIVDKIYYNIEDLFWKYQQERQYNRRYFLSEDFRNKCLSPIRGLLK